MKKEWFSTNELAGVDGLPTTKQGINQKARREQWSTRKRIGVQGKAVEYHIDSLPEKSRHQLTAKEELVSHINSKDHLLSIWVAAFHQLTEDERNQIITFIVRYGITKLLPSNNVKNDSSIENQ